MAVRTIKKQKGGEEDLLLGKGAESQQRHSGIVTVTKVEVTLPVTSFDGIRALAIHREVDLKFYPTRGYFTVLALGKLSSFDTNGAMFHWDQDSLLADDDATVLLPTGHVEAGRWRKVM